MEKSNPKLKNYFLYLFGIALAALVLIMLFSKNPSSTTAPDESGQPSPETSGQYPAPPVNSLKADGKYQAVIATDEGEITVDLFSEETPVTVNNFVFLSREGFYDGTIFHRVIADFMIQGGDPNGDGSGGPGYIFNDEKITLDYERGMVAMANRGPNTNGSQFFIMHKDYELPKDYVIFGQVTKGMETVDKIATVETTDTGSGEKSTPVAPVKVNKVTITES
ncbi:MAG: peptidyl-prolyl isomerase [Candidatus Gottesmanbacteria bacterium GW2011_GWA2_43_14]|uniref:Peptidyl-prolyl cis-trans isomerase n=1 Tax=Candidatus Gottesmanbacteria bacterium GW2011_GWA2_43_14 TaxID=1618443 RepID=A0A0G1GHC9_9BACT|nr:MAG: peptidyl-prolyl isomerase [Candidatus Gottesmanbacteria bacterium GW2011_GWA2_43_14]